MAFLKHSICWSTNRAEIHTQSYPAGCWIMVQDEIGLATPLRWTLEHWWGVAEAPGMKLRRWEGVALHAGSASTV